MLEDHSSKGEWFFYMENERKIRFQENYSHKTG